jgi:hypothetical protein
VVYFAGWKSHISAYPVAEVDAATEREIRSYRSSKGTLKFRLRDPIPYAHRTRGGGCGAARTRPRSGVGFGSQRD